MTTQIVKDNRHLLIEAINRLVDVINKNIPDAKSLDLRQARAEARSGDNRKNEMIVALLGADHALCLLETDVLIEDAKKAAAS